LGAQDTVYTGGGDARQYFESTFINGSCDSIYGSSSAVFNACTISITYSVTAHRGVELKGGVGGAHRGVELNGGEGAGGGGVRTAYLFVNSSLVKPQPGEAGYPAAEGKTVLGRPWGNLSFTVRGTFNHQHFFSLLDFFCYHSRNHCMSFLRSFCLPFSYDLLVFFFL
jgi:hypothetical protein